MPRAILYVESRPKDPARAAEYQRWYNDVHLAEVVAVAGFVSARRFGPVDDDGPFVAIFEIDADDLDAVKARVANARHTGSLSPSQAEVVSVRYLAELSAYAPASDSEVGTATVDAEARS
jgi:hypothetical protein